MSLAGADNPQSIQGKMCFFLPLWARFKRMNFVISKTIRMSFRDRTSCTLHVPTSTLWTEIGIPVIVIAKTGLVGVTVSTRVLCAKV